MTCDELDWNNLLKIAFTYLSSSWNCVKRWITYIIITWTCLRCQCFGIGNMVADRFLLVSKFLEMAESTNSRNWWQHCWTSFMWNPSRISEIFLLMFDGGIPFDQHKQQCTIDLLGCFIEVTHIVVVWARTWSWLLKQKQGND